MGKGGLIVLRLDEKRALLAHYKAEHGLNIGVETGIYQGGGSLMGLGFDLLYLLDFQLDNCKEAKVRCPEAIVVCGDSRWTLPTVANRLPGPALFWLDAHWVEEYDQELSASFPCPLLDELAAIPRDQGHVVLIDDLRLLGNETGWPTLGEVRAATEGFAVLEADDIMRLT